MDDGEEVEGDEDWRYGPLGRAGVLKDAETAAPSTALPVRDAQDAQVPPAEAPAAPKPSASPQRSGEVRPRTIWAYWAQGHQQMPQFFQMCVATWQRVNPHWDVRILQKSTVLEYLDEEELPNRFMEMTSHQTASDAVRLGVLSRYGGVWLDVNILVCGSLDQLCWNAITWGQKPAMVFFHPSYGTEALGGQDFVESWCLATKPQNPFFIRWRDTFKELFQDRLNIEGLLKHRLYKGLDLSGFEKLNDDFRGSGMEFREYLAIHAMCHRLLETEPEARRLWRDEFIKINAADTAFRLQMVAQASDMHMAQVLLLEDSRAEKLIEGVPLIKFRTPDYGPLVQLSPSQLKDRRHLLGRLLDPPAQAFRGAAGVGSARATVGMSSIARAGGRRYMAAASLAVLCRGLVPAPSGLPARAGVWSHSPYWPNIPLWGPARPALRPWK